MIQKTSAKTGVTRSSQDRIRGRLCRHSRPRIRSWEERVTPVFALVFWIMVVVYALAVGAQIGGQVFRAPRLTRWSSWGIAFGLALHTALVVWRWAQTGHVPVSGTFENTLLGGWFIVAMAAWAA